MHPGGSARARLEQQAFLVSDCRRRSHDQPENAALYGRAHGGSDPISGCRPYAATHSAANSCGHHSDRNTRGTPLSLFTEERGRKMKAIAIDHFGGLDSLVIKEIPKPEPKEGHVVIQV